MVFRSKESLEKRKLKDRLKRREQKKLMVQYKGHKCQICGLIDNCLSVYDFHHIDESKKEFKISGHDFNNKTKLELDKCIMICANCHRRIHTMED